VVFLFEGKRMWWEMKNRGQVFLLVLVVLAMAFTAACSGTSKPAASSVKYAQLPPIQAGQTPAEPRMRVGVVSFENAGNARLNASILADMLSSELWNSRKYEVIERMRIEPVLAEQGLSMSGRISDETAVRVGRLLGLNYVVIGVVYQASDYPIDGLGPFILGTSVKETKVAVSVRLVNAETGSVIFHGTGESTKRTESRTYNGHPDSYPETARNAIAQVVRKM
jgi:curli biogenesis system outer membrane secretion channel CsgG